jgi:hypothetical protein
MIPTPGTFRRLWVKLSAPPGAGKSWTFTFTKNGYNFQALTVTISGDTDTSGLDSTHSFTVSAAEIAAGTNGICMSVAPSGTPTACTARWGFEFEGDTAKHSMFGTGMFGNLSQTLTQYLGMDAGAVAYAAADEYKGTWVVPCNGTIKNICAILTVAPGTSKSRTFTVRKNGVDTACLLSFSGTETYKVGSTSVAVAAGDLISLSSVMDPTDGTVAASQVRMGIIFEAETDGDFIICNASQGQTPDRDINYFALPQAANIAWNATVGNMQMVVPSDFTIKSFYMKAAAAPGSGNTWDLWVSKNGSNLTATVLHLDDPATTDNATGLTEAIVAGDLLAYSIDGTSTPNWSGFAIAMCASMGAPAIPPTFLLFF